MARGRSPAKSPAFQPGFDFNPPNPFRRLHPPRQRPSPRHRHRLRSVPPWRCSAGSWRASIQDLSQSVLTPRFPRFGPPAGGKMASGPLLADHFQLPCLNRAMASTDLNRETAPGSIGKTERLYDRPAPQTRMAGTDCRPKRRLSGKGIVAWKIFFFLYCRAASALWWRASRFCCGHCWPCTDVPGRSGSSSPQGATDIARRALQ